MTAARKVSFNWPMWMLLGFAALMVLNLLATEIVYCYKNCMKNYTAKRQRKCAENDSYSSSIGTSKVCEEIIHDKWILVNLS